jgi:steroid delta-isomerase-like uncharacterized protein
MPRAATLALLERYYAAFNAGDWSTMLDCLADDVAHDINQGGRQVGKAQFAAFLAHMERCYKERLEDIALMVSEDGTRAAAEFVVHGAYLATDEGLPEADGQTYVLPAGAFLAIAAGRITRLTMYYNLADWTAQVDPGAVTA